ncbi:MAG: phosphoribosylformylglycinamidine cyclo-ligase, partial [Erysipelotrichaceae bacterium]|nr:phosphoribosylformylglycinamidine cyclo-ligase [Erysipelotrichaceae bacterium]
DIENADLNAYAEELGESLGEALLTPTRIYVKAINALSEEITIHGLSHITGGGFYENIPRCLDEGQSVRIDRAALKIPPVFGLIQKCGNISDHDMFNTFNMGVGMIAVVAPEDTEKALAVLKEQGEDAYLIGEVVESGEGVIFG